MAKKLIDVEKKKAEGILFKDSILCTCGGRFELVVAEEGNSTDRVFRRCTVSGSLFRVPGIPRVHRLASDVARIPLAEAEQKLTMRCSGGKELLEEKAAIPERPYAHPAL